MALNQDLHGRNPYQRMTLTFSAIERGRDVVFTASGKEKRAILEQLLDGEDLPANRVSADRVTWLIDRDAAPDSLQNESTS